MVVCIRWLLLYLFAMDCVALVWVCAGVLRMLLCFACVEFGHGCLLWRLMFGVWYVEFARLDCLLLCGFYYVC